MENFNTTSYSVPNISHGDYAEMMYSLSVVVPFTIIYIIIFISGVLGNVSTCIVIAKNKSMHTATNYYLFSLALSDLILLISGLPAEIYKIWAPENYVFGETFCFLQGFAAEMSTNATILTISAFTVERYLAICHPFFSQTMSKLSRAIRFIVVIWITALGLAIPQAVQFGIQYEIINGKRNSFCQVVNTSFEHSFEISTLVFFIVPMTLISILYILIGIQLRKSKDIAVHRGSCSDTQRGTMLKNNAAQKRVIKMLVAVVAAFFICWAPFHTQRLLAVYLSKSVKDVQSEDFLIKLYTILMYSSGLLYFMSTTINPILYQLLSNKYRKAFRNTFSEMCTRRRDSSRRYSSVSRDRAHFKGRKFSESDTMVPTNDTILSKENIKIGSFTNVNEANGR